MAAGPVATVLSPKKAPSGSRSTIRYCGISALTLQMRKCEAISTYDLFSSSDNLDDRLPASDWPDADRFPINAAGRKVRDTLESDLAASDSILIVTGYTSLDELIRFIGRTNIGIDVRLLFGNEPYPTSRIHHPIRKGGLPRTIRDHWIANGISVLTCGAILECLQKLDSGTIRAKVIADFARPLHAKIYVADKAATLGSSNFTHNGLVRQLEANARFAKDREPKRYFELSSIAENLWQLGQDYTDGLKALLGELLRFVTWQEALARACSELLEGDWAKAYIGVSADPDSVPLWPAQTQGIAQALYVLSRQGSVLVADATGSGKTLLGAHLIRAIRRRMLDTGRMRLDNPVMACPMSVRSAWQHGSDSAHVGLDVYSHGILSRGAGDKFDRLINRLSRTQLLCIDEAHNFLNTGSNRSQSLMRHMADNVVIFTATPINRSIRDLLPIIDLLGADNLEDETLARFDKLLRSPNTVRVADADLEELRREIQKFTVRRTKAMLNTLIDRDPPAYKDKMGRPCRYPRHAPHTYSLNEPVADQALAAEISDLAGELHAATYFEKPLRMPLHLVRAGLSEEQYLEHRLKVSKTLAHYQIMRALRSSRAALLEHILGTKAATKEYELTTFDKGSDTGNVVERLNTLSGRSPVSHISVDLPNWLKDSSAHDAACREDIDVYQRIAALVRRMSDAREQAKVNLIAEKTHTTDLVIAFDRSPISLAYIQKELKSLDLEHSIFMATGSEITERSKVMKAFELGSESTAVALCSDSLSEGVNLQQGRVLIHLDMPSVVRIAEQRVGRIDRMDSPHRDIEVWWPDDAAAFALSSDEKFVARFDTVERLLGSNVPLPESMQKSSRTPITAKEMIAETEARATGNTADDWDALQDAFDPVRQLIAGDSALIKKNIYDEYRTVKATVAARVSVVKARRPWAFFCLRGGSFQAPRWLLFPNAESAVISDLPTIVSEIRTRLDDDTESGDFDEKAAAVLEEFVSLLSPAELTTLPRKKRRALEEMAIVLRKFREQASERHDQEALDRYGELLDMLEAQDSGFKPDWDEVANLWLEIIRPIWYQRLKAKRRKPLLLKDIRQDVIDSEEDLWPEISRCFDDIDQLRNSDERISACIIGV